MAAGVQHTLLLCSDGAVKACGLNLDGQCAMPETGSLQPPVNDASNHGERAKDERNISKQSVRFLHAPWIAMVS